MRMQRAFIDVGESKIDRRIKDIENSAKVYNADVQEMLQEDNGVASEMKLDLKQEAKEADLLDEHSETAQDQALKKAKDSEFEERMKIQTVCTRSTLDESPKWSPSDKLE